MLQGNKVANMRLCLQRTDKYAEDKVIETRN